MIAVVDVSAAVEIILHKEKKDLFSRRIGEASWVIAPDLYVCELSNVLWKYYKAKALSRANCVTYVEDGVNLIDDFIDGRALWQEALGEGIKNNHSVYDMYYAILARRNNAVLLTCDGILLKLCKKLSVEICE